MQIVSGSISFAYHVILRGRKTIWILHVAFAHSGIWTWAIWAASECPIHYSITSQLVIIKYFNQRMSPKDIFFYIGTFFKLLCQEQQNFQTSKIEFWSNDFFFDSKFLDSARNRKGSDIETSASWNKQKLQISHFFGKPELGWMEVSEQPRPVAF